MCHPEGRSATEGARSALTRRPSRSYPRSPLVEPIDQGSAHPLLFQGEPYFMSSRKLRAKLVEGNRCNMFPRASSNSQTSLFPIIA